MPMSHSFDDLCDRVTDHSLDVPDFLRAVRSVRPSLDEIEDLLARARAGSAPTALIEGLAEARERTLRDRDRFDNLGRLFGLLFSRVEHRFPASLRWLVPLAVLVALLGVARVPLILPRSSMESAGEPHSRPAEGSAPSDPVEPTDPIDTLRSNTGPSFAERRMEISLGVSRCHWTELYYWVGDSGEPGGPVSIVGSSTVRIFVPESTHEVFVSGTPSRQNSRLVAIERYRENPVCP